MLVQEWKVNPSPHNPMSQFQPARLTGVKRRVGFPSFIDFFLKLLKKHPCYVFNKYCMSQSRPQDSKEKLDTVSNPIVAHD